MPYTPKLDGIELSVNEPTSLKVASKISTLLLAPSAANRKFPEGLLLVARPVYIAPVDGTAITAELGFTAGFQPLMVPSSVAKIKIAGEPLILKSDVPLKTMPVGVPGPSPPAVGMETFRATLVPSPLYNVDQPEPLSLIHHGEVGLLTKPQALTTSGSKNFAGLCLLE